MSKQIVLQKDVITTYYKLVIDGKQTDYVADITIEVDENGVMPEGYKVLWQVSIVKAPRYEFYTICRGHADSEEIAHAQVSKAAQTLKL